MWAITDFLRCEAGLYTSLLPAALELEILICNLRCHSGIVLYHWQCRYRQRVTCGGFTFMERRTIRDAREGLSTAKLYPTDQRRNKHPLPYPRTTPLDNVLKTTKYQR